MATGHDHNHHGDHHDHGKDDLRFISTPETRSYFGEDRLRFIEKSMLVQPNIAVFSQEDCDSEFQPTSSLTSIFTDATLRMPEQVCGIIQHMTIPYYASGKPFPLLPMNNKSVSPEQFVAIISRTEPGALQVDIEWSDVEFFMLSHEVGHDVANHAAGPDGHDETAYEPLKYMYEEYLSDQGAHQNYGRAFKEGLVTDGNLPQSIRSLRVIADIGNFEEEMSDAYTLTTLAGLPGIDIKSMAEGEAVKDDIVKAKRQVYTEIGKDLVDGAATEAETLSAGQDAAQANPPLLYETVRRMSLQAEFNSSPHVAGYMTAFVRAAETVGAQHFATDGRQTYPPEQAIAEPRQQPQVQMSADMGMSG